MHRWLSVMLFVGFLTHAKTMVRFVDAADGASNPNNHYFVQLLNEAMAISEHDYGPYELQPIDAEISQSRQLKELEKGSLDVFWTMWTPAREEHLQSVPIPLAKGSYGVRVLVVHRADLPVMQMLSEKMLTRKLALSGESWPDTEILRFNKYRVVSVGYDVNLYSVLSRDQRYYFPRGIFEADAELEALQHQDFVILPNLIIRYPVEMRFFVAKQNTVLAQRLAAGLKRLKQNGRFDQLFYQFAPHAAAIKRLNIANAKVLELASPYQMTSEQLQVIYAEQDQLLQRFGVISTRE